MVVPILYGFENHRIGSKTGLITSSLFINNYKQLLTLIDNNKHSIYNSNEARLAAERA